MCTYVEKREQKRNVKISATYFNQTKKEENKTTPCKYQQDEFGVIWLCCCYALYTRLKCFCSLWHREYNANPSVKFQDIAFILTNPLIVVRFQAFNVSNFPVLRAFVLIRRTRVEFYCSDEKTLLNVSTFYFCQERIASTRSMRNQQLTRV